MHAQHNNDAMKHLETRFNDMFAASPSSLKKLSLSSSLSSRKKEYPKEDDDDGATQAVSRFAAMFSAPKASWLLKGAARAGLERPTAVQALTVPAALCGCDVLAVAETGSGALSAWESLLDGVAWTCRSLAREVASAATPSTRARTPRRPRRQDPGLQLAPVGPRRRAGGVARVRTRGLGRGPDAGSDRSGNKLELASMASWPSESLRVS